MLYSAAAGLVLCKPCKQKWCPRYKGEQSLAYDFSVEAGSTTITIKRKLLVKLNKLNCIIRGDKITYQLTISDLDILFQYIYSFFKILNF